MTAQQAESDWKSTGQYGPQTMQYVVKLFDSTARRSIILRNTEHCTVLLDVQVKLNSRIVMAIAAFNKKAVFVSRLGFKLRKKSTAFGVYVYVGLVLKLGHFGQWIRNTWKVLKCGAGEWWSSVGPIVWEMKKCYFESMSRGISYVQWQEGRFTGLVTSWVGTAFWNMLLKKMQKEGEKRREDEEEYVSSYWMTFKKR